MNAERRFPGDLDPVVRVSTLDCGRVARLIAETRRSLIGPIVRGLAGSFGHLHAMLGLHGRPRKIGSAVRVARIAVIR
jgi:isopentenyl phosphate kinase